jgi:NAD(P)-dependent dehydrogenase (short-subunit alcohol dehydrogenase family)
MDLNGVSAVVSGGASGLGEATVRELAAHGAKVVTADSGTPLRVVVNSAGIGWAERTVNREGAPHALATYQKVISVNLIGTFNLMRIGASAIAKTEPTDADGQRGVVVNTASVAALEGQTGQLAYSASKGGIVGMTVPAARDLSVIGVRVNTICPGIIDTPIYGEGEAAEEWKKKLAAPVAFPKRLGTAAEFAHLVRMLVENDYMNGETIRFDGGIRFQPK